LRHGLQIPTVATLRSRPEGPLRCRGGMTLVEVLIALSLLLALMSAVAFSAGSFLHRGDLDRGASDLESSLRMARADAATRGKRIRMLLKAESPSVTLEWEPQPLTEPGSFRSYEAAIWTSRIPNQFVRVVNVQMVGESAPAPTGDSPSNGSGDVEPVEPSITFEPDGTCDSAIIELASLRPGDERRAMVEIDGQTGVVTSRITSSESLETTAQP